MFPNVHKSKLQVDADSECAYKHTAKPDVEKKNSASIGIRIPSNDERRDATTEKSVWWQDPIPSETFIISRTQYVHKKREIGPYIWSHPDWISKSGKFKRSNILRKICRMDLELGRKKQGQQLGFYTRTCTRFQVPILTIEIGSSNQVPRAMFLHSQKLRRKRETGASLQMMSKRDLFDSRRTGNESKV